MKNALKAALVLGLSFAAHAQSTVSGFTLSATATEGGDAVYSADATMPASPILFVPYVFSGDPAAATVTASLSGQPLEVIGSRTLTAGRIDYLLLDIENRQGETGDLRIQLASTSDTPSELTLISEINVDATPDPDGPNAGKSGGGSAGSFFVLYMLASLLLLPALGFKRR